MGKRTLTKNVPMHILVTGGAGYVGSLLVPSLLRANHTVTVLDCFLFEPRQFVKPIDGLHCVCGDLRDAEAVKRALDACEAVIHLAGISNDPSSELDPRMTWDINFTASCRLVESAREAGIRRFINASSASVYGVREESRVTEELDPKPQTIYARSKADCEAFVLSCNSKTFITTSVRPATLSGYSPRMRLDLTVNILTYQAVRWDEIRVFGGDQFRPNLSVRDMVRAYSLLLSSDPGTIGGRTFNLCQQNYRVLEIAERIKALLNKPSMQIQRIPTADNRSYRLCADRAARELQFSAQYDLDSAILDVADALADGRIPNSDDSRYRNVDWLRSKSAAKLRQVS